MELIGEHRIVASREEVWQALNDPVALRACIPGCEAVERLLSGGFELELAVVVGQVEARFKGKIGIVDPDPPRSYRLAFDGQAGAEGFAKGDAVVHLDEDGVATRLIYNARAQVGGRLAEVGAPLLYGAARSVADRFFSALGQRLGPSPPDPGTEPLPSPGQPARSILKWSWLGAGIIAAILLAYLSLG